MPPKRKMGSSARGLGSKRGRSTNGRVDPAVETRETSQESGRSSEVSEPVVFTFPPPATPVRNAYLDFDFTPSVQVAPENTSCFDPVGSFVPLKLKEKIWESQFVDLSLLLKSQRDIHEYVENGPVGELQFKNGTFSISSREQSTRLSINQWSSAFIVFIAIMLERFPARAQELLKYFRDIRLAASRSPNWWKYDEQFRQLKASNPSSSWGTINMELWLINISSSVGPSTTQGQSNAQFNKSSQKTPSATQSSKLITCHFFNSGNKCPFYPNCRFSHSCEACGGNHKKSTCRSHNK